MRTIIIMDVSSLGYAAQAATKLTCGEREVQAIFGVLNRTREIILKHENAKPIACWDGSDQARRDIYPAYKGKRNDNPILADMRKKFREQKADLFRGLAHLGVTQCVSKTSEADDLAGLLVKAYDRSPDTRVLLVSGDGDWKQLVRPNVTWYSPTADSYVHHDTFTDMTGYLTPRAFLEGKALQGDSSDNLPPVGGIGETGAPVFLAHFGSVDNFIKKFLELGGATLNNKGRSLVREIEGVKILKSWEDLALNNPHPKEEGIGRLDAFRRNVQLMNLLDVGRPADLKLFSNPLDKAKFAEFGETLNFRSMTGANLDSWTAPFAA